MSVIIPQLVWRRR